jgi:hypothetical protein
VRERCDPAGRDASGGKGGGTDPVRWREENAHLARAEEVQRSRPHWLVWWGVCSRRYWAIANFDTTNPMLCVYSADPGHLIAAMDDAERRFRIRPERKGR